MGRRVVIAGLTTVFLIAVAGTSAYLFLRGTSATAKVAKAMHVAGCSFANYAEQQSLPDYLTLPPNDPVPYNSSPPTSGRHFVTAVVWGVYGQPVSEYQLVTNLARGGIAIQWGTDVPAAEVKRVESFIQRSGTAMVGAPNALLGDKIAFTAWTHLATCTRFDIPAARLFRDTFRFH